MKKGLKPFSTTGIGSLPHLDPEEACRLIFGIFDIPFWPQMPKLSFLEWMLPQYSEGMPFINISTEKNEIYIRRNDGDDLERFYEACNEDCRIAISEDYAKGLHTFLKLIRGKRFEVLKGHITGPLTFTLGLKDADGRFAYFDEELRQIALMLLQAKARWQIGQLAPYAENVVIFIDEPILSAIGSSAYLGVSREEALRLIRETADAVKGAGAIPAIHCCGSADWPLVIESGVQIVNFDAYGYFETLSIYRDYIREFLEKGGYIAWGMVPTTDAINEETAESVIGKFRDRLASLSGHVSEELLLNRSILTPSCGTGSRSVQETIKIFQILLRLKEEFV